MSVTTQIGRQAFATNAGAASATVGHPLKSFLVLALGIGLSLLTIPLIIGVTMAPFLLGMVFIALLAPALIMTRRADGPGAIRQLLKRTLIWRFSPVRWAITIAGVPALTIAVASLSGTFSAPQDGWTSLLTGYVFNVFVVGALILNMWEETAWGGFLQTRMMARRGLIAGALITSIPFVVIHIPLQFEGDWTWSSVATNVAVLFLVTPFYRLLVGEHLLATGGSILAIGLLHASWNEAAKFNFVDGDWQVVTAVALLSLGLVAKQRLSTRSDEAQDTVEREREKPTAWIAPPKSVVIPSA